MIVLGWPNSNRLTTGMVNYVLNVQRIHSLGLWSVAQSCPTLFESMDCVSPGSSVLGILQARILEWGAMPSSRGSFLNKGLNWHLLCLLHW